jgi:hypothetical protein
MTDDINQRSNSSDEEMQNDDESQRLKDEGASAKNILTDTYWREKQKISSQIKISAHAAIIASKSSYLAKLLKDK